MRVLAIGDGAASTGFSRVTSSILSRLVTRYEIHQLAINYMGDPHDLPWKLYPASGGGGPFGVERIRGLVEELRPDLVFTVNDFWVQQEYWKELARWAPEIPIVSYSPVDAGPIDPEWTEALPERVTLVVYTEFARQQVARVLPPERAERIRVVPHGVDTSLFYPQPKGAEAAARDRLSLPADAFIVLNANRNQPRKRIDLTLEGFAKFAEGKPENVQLLLHMGLSDVGWDVRKLAARLGIERRVIVTGPASGRSPSISDEQMNLVYNACDVGVNTSGGEGWGLAALEHAAARRAQIVPRHSALEEIWNDAARFVEAPDRMVQPTTLLEFHFTRAALVAEALGELYESPEALERTAERCYAASQRIDYSWDAIAETWEGIFRVALGEGVASSAPSGSTALTTVRSEAGGIPAK